MRALITALLLAACGDGVASSPDAAAGQPDGAGGPAWQTRAPLGAGPRQETGVAALGGLLYVVGGFDDGLGVVDLVEIYDPATDVWSTAAPLPIAVHHANVAAAGGKLYVLGALEGLGFTAIGNSYEYDPAADAWTPLAPMPAGSERGSSAVGVIGDIIYVAGGSRGGSVADFSAFDTAAGTWAPLPDLPEARDHLVGGAVSGIFYAIGGRNGGITALRDGVDAFDPATAQWTARAPMPTARGGAAAGIVGGLIHVAGGEGNAATGSGVFADHEAYDPATDTWTVLAPMDSPRHGTGGAGIGDYFHVAGGANVQAFGAVDTHEAFGP